MKTLLLGDGWVTVWYLVHYMLLWPLWSFYAYFRDFKPGAGPQGGEAMLVCMCLYVLAVVGVALCNGVALVVAGRSAWSLRCLIWPLGLLVLSTVAVIGVLALLMDYAATRHGISGRVLVCLSVAVFAGLFLGANFVALASIRGSSSSAFKHLQPL